jgi:hypothetical protein
MPVYAIAIALLRLAHGMDGHRPVCVDSRHYAARQQFARLAGSHQYAPLGGAYDAMRSVVE